MNKLSKTLKNIINKVNKLRIIGNYKISFTPILPIKIEEDKEYPHYKKGKEPNRGMQPPKN